jgi:hypothetical protein
MFSGIPFYFYLWLLVVKTPIPILVAMLAGGIMLLLRRHSIASCMFLCFGLVQLTGLSVSGAKWMRYSLPMLPFLFLAAGFAVQTAWAYMRRRQLPVALTSAAALILFIYPLLELLSWAPSYALYLNAFGGGTRNVCRYFAPDEVSEFDSREVVREVCRIAPPHARLATARPMSMSYYLDRAERSDIEIIPIYDPHYVPRSGDLIILEPSRRFFETAGLLELVKQARMPHQDVHVGLVTASVIYRFQPSMPRPGNEVALLANSKQANPYPVKPVEQGHDSVPTRFARGRAEQKGGDIE